MDQQTKNLQDYYNIVIKMEHKSNTFLQNIDKLSETSQKYQNLPNSENKPTVRSSQLFYDLNKQIQLNGRKIQKYISNAEKQIQKILAYLNEQEQEAGDLHTKYEILNNTHKEVQASVKSLKYDLQKNKKTIHNQKKLSSLVESLQEEVNGEKQLINKLLLSQNKTTRLHNQIVNKLQQLDGKQRNLQAKQEWQEKVYLDIERYGQDSEKYASLLQQKTNLYQTIDRCVTDGNRKYMEKIGLLTTIKSKIQNINDIYAQMEINASQQNFIIKEIILREGLAGAQLLQSYQEQQQLDNIFKGIDANDSHQNVQKLRKKLGVSINSQTFNEQIRKLKLHTQPITKRQYDNEQYLNQQRQTEKQMRQTKRVLDPVHRKKGKSGRLQANKQFEQRKLSHYNAQKNQKNLGGGQFPKLSISSNMKSDQFYLPISHIKVENEQRRWDRNVKKHNSEQITKNKIYKKSNSMLESKIKGKLQTDSHLVRIRTKNGYIFKNNSDQDSEKESINENKSEIVSLYEKLSKIGEKDVCNCDDDDDRNERESMQGESQRMELLQGGMKAGLRRKKGRQCIHVKNMLESRESDGDIENETEGSRKAEVVQLRKRLKTIHQGEEEQKQKMGQKQN